MVVAFVKRLESAKRLVLVLFVVDAFVEVTVVKVGVEETAMVEVDERMMLDPAVK